MGQSYASATRRRKKRSFDYRMPITLHSLSALAFEWKGRISPIQALYAACNKLVVVNLCLLLLTVFSALAVVYSKHSTRLLNNRLQQLANQRDVLQAEWTQLMLEQGTWATNARVEDIASKHLNMVSPPPQDMRPLVTLGMRK